MHFSQIFSSQVYLEYQFLSPNADIFFSINSGSSSVKIVVYSTSDDKVNFPKKLMNAQVTGLNAHPAQLTYELGLEKIKNQEIKEITSNKDACGYILIRFVNDKGLLHIPDGDAVTHGCH